MGDDQETFHLEVHLPGMLSILAQRAFEGYVPGLNDLVYGNASQGIMGAEEKIVQGKRAVQALAEYKAAVDAKDRRGAAAALKRFRADEAFFGYGFFDDPAETIPPVGIMFYSFHLMVGLGFLFILVFMLILWYQWKGKLPETTWLLKASLPLFFLGFLASEAGWLVAEMGRQPWAIQEMLPVQIARTNLDTGTVATTFFIFLVLFTALLAAEIKIMLTQIKHGPEEV